jgi:hypothetical protein
MTFQFVDDVQIMDPGPVTIDALRPAGTSEITKLPIEQSIEESPPHDGWSWWRNPETQKWFERRG